MYISCPRAETKAPTCSAESVLTAGVRMKRVFSTAACRYGRIGEKFTVVFDISELKVFFNKYLFLSKVYGEDREANKLIQRESAHYIVHVNNQCPKTERPPAVLFSQSDFIKKKKKKP